MADYCLARPQEAKHWHEVSEYLICLEAQDLTALALLISKAAELGIDTTTYTEPDMNNAITAVVFSPGSVTRKLLANLPCAGKRASRLVTATQAAQNASSTPIKKEV